MQNQFWTYALAVMVFFLPICAIEAIQYDAQTELSGAANGCKQRCESRLVRLGDCSVFCWNGCDDEWVYGTNECNNKGFFTGITCSESSVTVGATVIPCGCFGPMCIKGNPFPIPVTASECKVISRC